jgi:CRP-like cAMP-binding protein
MEIVRVGQFTQMVHRGDPPDAMYGVLEGELRSSLMVEGKECPLATLSPGSIFGEISLFDRGPHTVNVIANQDCVLIKFSTEAINRITKEAPDAGLALLFGLIKAIAGRVRTLTRRYEDSVQIAARTEARRTTLAA